MPAKLLREYQQTIKTYEVLHPTIGKPCLVNSVTNTASKRISNVSISVEGIEILDEDQRKSALEEIQKYENTLP